MHVTFRNAILIAGALAMAATTVPASAQFRGLFRDAERGARAAEGCEADSTGDAARGALGGILGGVAGRTASRAGLGSFVPVSRFSGELTAEIACKLNEDEQEQASEATLQATRAGGEDGTEGPPVGQSASWTSQTRDDVSGSSTVSGREDPETGYQDCVTVTDVIIVEGEETRAEKRMCRLSATSRYTIVA